MANARRELELKRPAAAGQGIDELNFAEFPLALISTTAPAAGQALVYEDEVDDEGSGRRVRRKLTIEAPANVGLPLPRDADVLLVLTRHALRSHGEVLRRVSFRRGEFLEVLGWDDSGQSYRRLDESLRRWTGVVLHYANAWWDKSHKRWRTRTFHVLDEIELAGGEASGGGELDGPCWFTWGDTVFQSLRARNVRSLDLDQYFKLTRPASRQAYRFLGKRFWHKQRLHFDLRTFCCEHLGFSRKYDIGGLKRAVLPVLDELAAIGFITVLPERERFQKRGTGDWQIVIAAQATSSAEVAGPTPNVLAAELVARGVSAAAAKRLAASYSEARIREKLALVDRLAAQPGRPRLRSPGGFLVKAIEQDYDARQRVPQSAVPPTQLHGRSTTSPRRVQPVIAAPRDELAHAARHLAALAGAERAALEQAAVAASDDFHRRAVARLQVQGGRLLEELKLKLVTDYLSRSGVNNVADGRAEEVAVDRRPPGGSRSR